MRRERRVKILATLGPASSSPDMIRKLYEAGADVFRINMSHASHERLEELYYIIRDIEDEANHCIGILVDLQGPKLRIGDIGDGARSDSGQNNGSVRLERGASFIFDRNPEPGDATRVYLPHPEIFAAVEEGHNLLIDDGKLRLVVMEHTPDQIRAEVAVGGKLSSRKGVSLPDTLLPMGAMTDKDRKDLEFASELGVDWVALSFVQREEDVLDAKKVARMGAHARKNNAKARPSRRTEPGVPPAIMSKIEKPTAVKGLSAILDQSDGIMIARGDLGVEMPVEQVPGIQKEIIRAAREAGKPVVVATQMLESMIHAPVPTRAEVSDVATAVYEGADAVMLSAESAAGEYPVEAVTTLNKVAVQVEKEMYQDGVYVYTKRASSTRDSASALTAAACSVAHDMKLACIVCYTSTGATAMRAARQRPKTPILVLTTCYGTARRLAMVWGLYCVYTHDPRDTEDMVQRSSSLALQYKFGAHADKMIIAAGLPFGTPGATNMLRIVGMNGDAPRK
jgi:pyruvate kinase